MLADDTFPVDTIVRDTTTQRARALATGAPQTATLKGLRGDGLGDYTVVLVPCPQDEVVALVHDVSNLPALEDQLLRMQALATVGLLAGGLAHDLGNLLTSIMAYWQMAEGARGAADAREIRIAAEQSATLCRRLLALFHDQSTPPENLDLGELVEDMTSLLRSQVGATVQVEIRSQPGLGPVRAVRGRIENIVLNLAVNARDAMPAGGKITLSTSNVTVGDEPPLGPDGPTPGDYVVLEVTDTGIGIDEEVRPFIFEPFFTTKGAETGTGLGLYLCSGAVAKSGGYIAVHSEPDIGTSFSIYLPRLSRPNVSGTGLRPRGGETVLLVEDEPAVRRVVSTVLRDSGYRVLEASEGSEALELVSEQGACGIHLLLTDLTMPRIGGLDLARQVRRLLPGIRVLYTSGYSGAAMEEVRIHDPEAMFIGKPFTPSELAEHVKAALGS
jgi:signal transduction histidine kinase/CheY-like chemotaxis protein